MRNAFSEQLYTEAIKSKDVYIVVSDISPVGSMDNFSKKYPERFLNVGVAEQSMIGISAGLALQGKIVFAYTIATFSLYRPFEMVRVDLCYQNLPVTVVGMGAGVIYSTLGGTHHTMEDVAVTCAIPNMQVIAPCDPNETKLVTSHCANQKKGPIYLRLGKAGEPNLTDNAEPWKFGKIRYLRRGKSTCIISYGITCSLALKLSDELDGGRSSVVNCHTIKPLDEEGLKKILKDYNKVIVIEEMVYSGSLSSQVESLAWKTKSKTNLHVFTLKDKFIHCYGSHEQLLNKHEISVPKILKKI